MPFPQYFQIADSVMKEAEDNAAAADNRANKLYDEVQDAHQVRTCCTSCAKLATEDKVLDS
eukprot:3536287-Amphidinium_carterae.1